VIECALAPYAGPIGRVALNGLPIRLASAAAVSLSLAFHELATNAAKYGALSVPEGGVAVTWTRRRAESGKQLLEIVWREHDGPLVQPPARRGFGSRLLARSLQHEFGCTVHHDFPLGGVECRICLPLTATVLGV
jgi:two-component sensor histidine kinase